MRLALIGVGQAGGRIVDEFLRYDRRAAGNVVRSATVVNTAEADLHGLELVPRENRILVGTSRVGGHGVGADSDLASTILAEDIDSIRGALDEVPVHEVDAFLVVAGLGGGTGSGGGPVVVRELERLFTEPVYGLGALPSEGEGGLYTSNAARSLRAFVREADSLLVFDNEAWREPHESAEDGYATMNEALVRRLWVLFSAGERSPSDVGARVVDSSEIVNTLEAGGLASIGYATAEHDGADGGLLSRFDVDVGGAENSAASASRITGLVRKAALGRLTLPCEVDAVGRALLLIAGPPNVLNRKGIERAQNWLVEETGCTEVRYGDYPLRNEDVVAAVVLLSGLSEVPRVDALRRGAVAAHDATGDLETANGNGVDGLLDDELDPLF